MLACTVTLVGEVSLILPAQLHAQEMQSGRQVESCEHLCIIAIPLWSRVYHEIELNFDIMPCVHSLANNAPFGASGQSQSMYMLTKHAYKIDSRWLDMCAFQASLRFAVLQITHRLTILLFLPMTCCICHPTLSPQQFCLVLLAPQAHTSLLSTAR